MMPNINLSSGFVLLVASAIALLMFWRRSRKTAMNSATENDLAIIKEAKKQGLSSRLATYLVGQARHESDNYRSRLARDLNNVFGMGLPRIRPTIAMPSGVTAEGQEMAKYNSIEEAVRDLKLWMGFSRAPNDFPSLDAYVNFLKQKGYFTDSAANYLAGVSARMRQSDIL